MTIHIHAHMLCCALVYVLWESPRTYVHTGYSTARIFFFQKGQMTLYSDAHECVCAPSSTIIQMCTLTRVSVREDAFIWLYVCVILHMQKVNRIRERSK